MKFKTLALASIVAAFFGLATTAAPAYAAATCPSGKVCLYKNSNFTGSALIPPFSCEIDLTGWKYWDGSSANKSASSIINNTDRVISFYEKTHLSGRYIMIAPHSAASQLTNVHINATSAADRNFDNTISSFC